MEDKGNAFKEPAAVKSLVLLCSYHHHNTEKVANAIAEVLDAPVKAPRQVRPEELQEYDLVGFGSGVYDAMHHRDLLELADALPQATNGKVFLFSTYGAPYDMPAVERERAYANEFHIPLGEKLQAKGYRIVGEFSRRGWNTNSFLKPFGGLNKGRPSAEDLRQAQEFAGDLKNTARRS